VTFSLEKISDTTRAAPGMIMERKINKKKKKKQPSNVISGVYRGTTVLIGSVFEGVTGIVVEPFKGAKEKGVKGATIGVGKGILGLICKPIAGSIDMITNTFRGIGNTPGSIYIGAKKIFRRKICGLKINYEYPPILPYIPSEQNDVSNKIFIGEDEEGEIYVDKEELKQALKKHGMYEEEEKNDNPSRFPSYLLNSSSNQNSEIKNQDFDSERLAIITDLVRKKHLKRLRASLESEDEFYTCRDESDYSESSQLISKNDIEVFMVKPIIIKECNDSSSIYDSDDDEDDDQYYFSSLTHQEDRVDSESNLSSSDDETQLNPIKIKTIGRIHNKFVNPSRKRRRTKKKPIIPTPLVKSDSKEAEKQKKKQKIINIAKKLKPVKRSDDFRISDAHPNGGFALLDQNVINKYRNVAKEIIKRIGSQILRGRINLTNISFPIKCMGKMSHLEALASIMWVFPWYLTCSAFQTDPIERMKWFLVGMISGIPASHMFEKPLNPILGETFVGEWDDGSVVYWEQTCHKPPVTHAQFYGPDDCYVMSMHTGFSAKAGFNSVTLNWTGKKKIVYKDGTEIYWERPPNDIFGNTFFGTFYHQFIETIEYFDDTNNIYACYTPGKEKIQDYIEGYIEKDGEKVWDISGSYVGYLEFDGVRYWDVRDTVKLKVNPTENYVLPSDSRFREDLISFKSGDVEEAQNNKEKMEQDQRNDAKLRGGH
jgi:hypothetical protein